MPPARGGGRGSNEMHAHRRVVGDGVIDGARGRTESSPPKFGDVYIFISPRPHIVRRLLLNSLARVCMPPCNMLHVQQLFGYQLIMRQEEIDSQQ